MTHDKTALVKEVLQISLRKMCSTFGFDFNPDLIQAIESDKNFIISFSSTEVQ